MVEGAVYRPFEIVPTGGLSVQETAVFPDPVTVAVALLLGSAALVAMTVTFWELAIEEGAV